MVMGDDSCSKGHGFKSRRCILDVHDIFFTLISCGHCIVCLKRPKINEKEAGFGPFYKKEMKQCLPTTSSLICHSRIMTLPSVPLSTMI